MIKIKMSYEKEIWNLIVSKTKELLQEDYSRINLNILTEYVTGLDSYMEKYNGNDEWLEESKEYELIHEKYGRYRWRNNV
jgi:hypothetical protein